MYLKFTTVHDQYCGLEQGAGSRGEAKENDAVAQILADRGCGLQMVRTDTWKQVKFNSLFIFGTTFIFLT